jgi:hypothetical protein
MFARHQRPDGPARDDRGGQQGQAKQPETSVHDGTPRGSENDPAAMFFDDIMMSVPRKRANLIGFRENGNISK